MAFIYLASPYTDPSPLVRQARYQQVAEVTAQILTQSLAIYSPIVHCHELAKRYALPKDFTFWSRYNYAMLIESSGLFVLELEGWKNSKGVQGEVDFAIQKGIPITYLPYPILELPSGA